MTAADAYVMRLGRLERELASMRDDLAAVRRPSWFSSCRRACGDVGRFLHCWALGHPEEARPGAACPHCGDWVPCDRSAWARASAPALAAIHHADLEAGVRWYPARPEPLPALDSWPVWPWSLTFGVRLEAATS